MCLCTSMLALEWKGGASIVLILGKIVYILVLYNISWIAGSEKKSTKRERPSRTFVLLLTKHHGVLLTERVQFLPWGFVRRPTRNYGDLRSQSRPTVDRVKRISFHLVIKFTFFVVLDTCQSIKRKLSWGRYWGWGNSLLVYCASDWLMPGAYYPTPITPNNLTAGKKG